MLQPRASPVYRLIPNDQGVQPTWLLRSTPSTILPKRKPGSQEAAGQMLQLRGRETAQPLFDGLPPISVCGRAHGHFGSNAGSWRGQRCWLTTHCRSYRRRSNTTRCPQGSHQSQLTPVSPMRAQHPNPNFARDHLPNVTALIPSQTAPTAPVTITVMTALNA